MEQKIKCMLDKVEYKNKPQGNEIAKITNRLINGEIEIDIQDLANKLIKGCTFKPSFLNGKREENWIQQQLFALDFDDGMTINQALNKCIQLNILPVFGYTSFSHTEENNRFRLVFCTDNVITDYEIAKQLQLILMSIFVECDDKCKNLSRLYFGGKELIYEGYDNRMDYKDIMEKHLILDEEKKPRKSKGNTIIPLSPRGEKPLTKNTTENKDSYYNIKALRDRNVEYLKAKIGNPHIILENNQAFFDYIKGYDLGKLLEIKYSTSFRCIFHKDNKPSAGIFKNDEGTYIYHCFSCGKSYNIINLVEVLGNFKSRPKAYKFIRDIFNLEISETEWQKEQKEILRENHRMLLNGELEKQCPTTYKNIKRNIKYLDQLFFIAEDNVYSEKFTDDEGNVVFYASNTFICDRLGMSKNSSIEVTKKNVLFQYHELLNKLSDEEIPEEMLKRSKAIGINSGNKHYKHINYFSIPSYTTNTFDSIENKGKQWNKNNYTMKGLSREMVYRTEGLDVANKLYPQYKGVYDKNKKQVVNRTTTNISNVRTDLIVTIIKDILSVKSYVTDKEIIDELSASGEVKTSKSEAEKQLKKSTHEILDSYNLKRIRCNKKIKEQYRMVETGYPFIIVQK